MISFQFSCSGDSRVFSVETICGNYMMSILDSPPVTHLFPDHNLGTLSHMILRRGHNLLARLSVIS